MTGSWWRPAAAGRVSAALILGCLLTLLSTFAAARTATATYPEIMGCESGCTVAATGWPLTFVRDYPGMSVVNTADILEVAMAADRIDWLPFMIDQAAWSGLVLLTWGSVRALSTSSRQRRP